MTTYYAAGRRAGRAALLLSFVLFGAASLRAQTFDQVRAVDERLANGTIETRRTAADAAGNLIVAGYFRGTVTFGNFVLEGPVDYSTNEPTVFVAKLSPSGQWLWAVRGGGGGPVYQPGPALGLALDASGDVFVAGLMQGTGTFGPAAAAGGAPLTVASAGGTDGFVARLDGGTGAWRWVSRNGGAAATDTDALTALTLDGSGHVFVGGRAEGGATFSTATGSGNGPTLVGSSAAMLLARLDATTGAWQWVSRAAEANRASISTLAYDGTSALYLAGTCTGTATAPATFSPAASGGAALLLESAGGSADALVAAVDAATGAFRWAVRGGSTATDGASSLAVDAASGRLYVSGGFLGGQTVGTYPPVTHSAATFTSGSGPADLTLNSQAGTATEPFVAQLETATGRWRWLSAATGAPTAELAVGTGGALYVGGTINSTATFRNPAGGPANLVVPTTAGATSYVARLDASSGTWSWVTPANATGSSTNSAYALRLDPQGRLCLAGIYRGVLAFGTAVPPLAGNGAFVARFDPATGAAQLLAGSESGVNTTVRALTTDATGNVYVAGAFETKLVLGTTTLISDFGDSDGYIGKRNAAGQWLWAARITGPMSVNVTALAADQQGHLYVAGETMPSNSVNVPVTTTFVGPTGPNLTISAIQSVAFVARLDAATGQWQWVSQGSHTAANVRSTALAVDAAGVPYVTGMFGSVSGQPATFTPAAGSTPLTLSGVGSFDVFVGRLRPADGQWEWVARGGTPGSSVSGGLAVDGQGSVFVGGTLGGGDGITATFTSAAGPAISTTNLGNGDHHAFVGALNAATGAWRWVSRTHSSSYRSGAAGTGLAVDGANHVFLAGTYNTLLPNEVLTMGQMAVAGDAYSNLLVARLDATTGAWQWLSRAGGGAFNAGNITLDSQGHAYMSELVESRYRGTPTTLPYFESLAGSGNTMTLPVQVPTNLYLSYVARLNTTTGAWEAATSVPALGASDGISCQALDGQNNLYLGGSFTEKGKAFGPVAVANGGYFMGTGFVARIGNAAVFLASSQAKSVDAFAAYPSPVAPGQLVRFQTAGPLPAGTVVEAYSALGQRVGRWPVITGAVPEVAAPRTPGFYVLRLRMPTEVRTARLVVE